MNRPTLKVALITRSTLHTVPGGDTVQVLQTARHLALFRVEADIVLSHEPLEYANYDLLHFFNLTRPADILRHARKTAKRYVISSILCDYSEFDRQHRKGKAARLLRFLSPDGTDYVKTLARCLIGGDQLGSFRYLWQGQRNSIIEVLNRAQRVLPNSESEYRRLTEKYPCQTPCSIVPNGTDEHLFPPGREEEKDDCLVICAARIEGIKNQRNLILALNHTRFNLLLIGSASPNQQKYYQECRRLAASNIVFIDRLPQTELAAYYRKARVHVLASWFETTGLSSLEAGLTGCNLVVSNRGDVFEYFGNDAFYCEPGSPESIYAAVDRASRAPVNEHLQQRILHQYTWRRTAEQTALAYQLALS